jgi:nucleoside-diphosphate-sugar epimerase
LVRGDVTDVDAIRAAMPQQVDAIFHVAADTSQWSKRNAQQTAINVGGTQNMVDIALEKEAGRFIHTSSISSYGVQSGIIDEETPSVAAKSIMNYERSKFAADEVVRKAVGSGLDATILNPTAIIGPADTGNWARSFFVARDGSIPGAPAGGTSTCDVRDVADTHIAAYGRGRTGESYLLGGKIVTYKDMLTEVAAIVGSDVSLRAIPPILMVAFGTFNSLVANITGNQPEISREIAYMMSRTAECTGEKARRELGYVQRDWRESMQDSFDWLVAEGLF